MPLVSKEPCVVTVFPIYRTAEKCTQYCTIYYAEMPKGQTNSTNTDSKSSLISLNVLALVGFSQTLIVT